jgi:hypothetical protein
MARMRFALALLGILAVACAEDRSHQPTVDVIRVAPMQLVADSLEMTPALDTAQNTPEQGLIALSIEVHVRNASGSTKRVPAIGFRAVPEGAPDTMAHWRHDITRRAVDSLRAGESATFGVTTSPASLAADSASTGLYRIEAVLGDPTTGLRALPLGRIRLRAAADST